LQVPEDVLIEDSHIAGGDCAHSQFFVTGHAKLADNEHIEGSAQGLGNLVGYWHAATRESKHEHTRLVGIGSKQLSQLFPSVMSISISCFHSIRQAIHNQKTSKSHAA
jgi:hypothetical protein